MNGKRKANSHVRGWLPQPTFSVIRSTQLNHTHSRLRGFTSLAPSGLMAVASLLSGFFGIGIVSAMLPLFMGPRPAGDRIIYSSFYAGIIGLAVFVLGSYVAYLLLTRKHTTTAIVGIGAVMALWLTTSIAQTLEGINVKYGLVWALLIMALSIPALLLTAFNKHRENKLTVQKAPKTPKESLVVVLGITGTGLALIGLGFSAISYLLYHVFYYTFSLITPAAIVGVFLLVAAYFVRRTYKH